jgi:hypothetical protein
MLSMLTYADVYYIHRSYMRDYYVNDSVVNACVLDAWDQETLDVDDTLDVKSRDANHPLVLAHPGYISVGGGMSRSWGGGMAESKADGLEEDAVGFSAGEVRARAGVKHSALRNSEISGTKVLQISNQWC